MKAIDNFDTTLQVKFSTYAVPTVQVVEKSRLKKCQKLLGNKRFYMIELNSMTTEKLVVQTMKILYKNPGFEHSIDSIMLFQTDNQTLYWSDALLYFYPQVKKQEIAKLNFEEKKKYVSKVLYDVYHMVIDGKPILETLDKYYRENKIHDFMEQSYKYCLEFEKDIRYHINEAERECL